MLYIDQLLDLLHTSDVGLWIERIFVVMVAPANDVCILAITPFDLQAMLDIVYAYSCKWRYTFSASNTVILVFGMDARSFKKLNDNKSLMLGNMQLSHPVNTWVLL